MYELRYKKKAIKALSKINEHYYSSLIQSIDNLALNPRPNGYKKLTGRIGFRIRVGNFRIIYNIEDHFLIIEIINIGSRGVSMN